MAITQDTNYALPKLNTHGLRQVVDEVSVDLHLIPGVGLRNAIANKAFEAYKTHKDFLTSEQQAYAFVESFIATRLEHYAGRSR